MSSSERIALVTGASQGIGRSVVQALAAGGFRVLALARTLSALETLAAEHAPDTVIPLPLDLGDESTPSAAAQAVRAQSESLDVLVHCGGTIVHSQMAAADLTDFQLQWHTNVLGPYALTGALLPLMLPGSDVVFVNSSVTRHPRAFSGQFSATMHALVGIADSLRCELNDRGVRVTSVFPGSTATPRQEALHRSKGQEYRPELLLQPESVAASVLHAVSLPRTAEITEIHIRPHRKG